MKYAGEIIAKIFVRESAQNDAMIFEIKASEEAGKAEIWEPYGSASLATVPDDGNVVENAEKLLKSWFPGAELE